MAENLGPVTKEDLTRVAEDIDMERGCDAGTCKTCDHSRRVARLLRALADAPLEYSGNLIIAVDAEFGTANDEEPMILARALHTGLTGNP